MRLIRIVVLKGARASARGILSLRNLWILPLLIVSNASCAEPVGDRLPVAVTGPTRGPLRVSSINPRYFADRNGHLVYLTGAHTWSNFQDNGITSPPQAFNYTEYLDDLAAQGHNFIRMWTWEQAAWTAEIRGDYRFQPLPYERSGPGLAIDGGPKFDLTRFNQAYFDRLRRRIVAARDHGIYVSIMLFNGWSLGKKGQFSLDNPWKGHPFNAANNVNGINGDIDGDGEGHEVHSLQNPAVLAVQKAYVKKVVDTVGNLDNVLYEVSNESSDHSMGWQEEIARFIRVSETNGGFKHPVGMTVEWPGGTNAVLLSSTADWISPNGGTDDPPAADGRKVIIEDTDHLCGICGDIQWVWKSFLRGRNPIFMDPYDGRGIGVGAAGVDAANPRWEAIRRNLGYTAAYARRVDLAAMRPRGDLSSSGYCLASTIPGHAAYLTLVPEGGTIELDLTATPGPLRVEWFSPEQGTVVASETIHGGAKSLLHSPFRHISVAYLYSGVNPRNR